MDIQGIKLDLISWLSGLKDEGIITMLKAIKDSKEEDLDTLITDTPMLKELLDSRVQEDAAQYPAALTSLAKIREDHGL